MDFDKLKQWMEMAQKYQSGSFWNGLFDQSSFHKFMKETMDAPTGTAPPSFGASFPSVDIYATDTEVIVVAELAGYTKENLHISVSGNKLLLKGASSHMIAGQPVMQERHQGPFERLIELPEPAFSNQVKATFRNGLLTLTYKRNHYEEEKVTIE
jgi:HSP20 family protein